MGSVPPKGTEHPQKWDSSPRGGRWCLLIQASIACWGFTQLSLNSSPCKGFPAQPGHQAGSNPPGLSSPAHTLCNHHALSAVPRDHSWTPMCKQRAELPYGATQSQQAPMPIHQDDGCEISLCSSLLFIHLIKMLISSPRKKNIVFSLPCELACGTGC